jgi:hypothetical protein
MFQMAKECINLFHSKALQNLPKLVFFGLKKCHLATLTVGRGTPEFNLGTLTDVEGAL